METLLPDIDTGSSTYPGNPDPTNGFWARKDPVDLIPELHQRKEAYFRFIDSSPLFARIFRLWQYYYDQFYSGALSDGDMELKIAGDHGEVTLISVNHLRSLIHLIMTFVTANRPAWDTMAINADHRSLEQTYLGNQILDDVMERKKVERRLFRAVEHSLVLTEGYVLTTWDREAGRSRGGMSNPPQLAYEGDVRYENPTIFDVVRDYTVTGDWEDHNWFFIRRPRSRWNSMSRYATFPEIVEKIKEAPASSEAIDRAHAFGKFILGSSVNRDIIDEWHFFHKACPELPMGRHVVIVGSTCLLDEDYEEPGLPLFRVVPAELIMTSCGYSQGLDLLGSQELLNGEFSTIASNHKNFGQLKVWLKTGNSVNEADLSSGMTVIQCDDKPEPFNLLQTPPEIYEMIKVLVQHMEYVSGVNSVARGQPEASLKSGPSLALVDQKAQQFATPLQGSYYQLLSDVGTATLRLYQKYVGESPRVVAIAGIHQRAKLKEFTARDIDAIDRVRVVPGNPLLRTTPGRYSIAELLVQAGVMTQKEEILTLLDTGQLEPLTQGIGSQLSVIHEENDLMLGGQMPNAYATDPQVLHIQEHHSRLNSISIRNDPAIMQVFLGHITQHTQLLLDPEVQLLQSILGYMNPLAGMGQGTDMGGGQPMPGGKPGGMLNAPRKESPAEKQVEGQAPEGMNPDAIESVKSAMRAEGIA